jgi:hypothetical protein
MAPKDGSHGTLFSPLGQLIEATISDVTSTGLEELENKKTESNLHCASCMVGKATLQSYQHKKDQAFRPLGQ